MSYPQANNPLILSYNRLMDAFAKSDDERDFYLDRVEGFLVYADLDKSEEDLFPLLDEVKEHRDRYVLIPKMTFYEVKKIMEGFVNEKVYDIDTKEKLLDIIGAKEARENFLEFIYDHLTELEKWQQFYQERSRIHIIEWLRSEEIHFVFEEDLDIQKPLMEKIKRHLFDKKAPKEVLTARTALGQKAKTYYSNEALNPRPKRGRPPKQSAKIEIEPQLTVDIYTTVPSAVRHFLYLPDIRGASSVTFSAKFETEADLLKSLRGSERIKVDERLEALSERLESLRLLSSKFSGSEKKLLGKEQKSFQPFLQPKFKKDAEISVQNDQEDKMEAALEDVLPKKRKRSKEQEEEYPKKKRKNFSIKKVTQIKKKSS
ncbi:MAG: UPF0158 family protein [Chlamydiota bacterium]